MILRKRDPSTSLRTQYKVQNETQIRENQKVIKNDNDELIVLNYPRNNQVNNNKILNHLTVPPANKIFG